VSQQLTVGPLAHNVCERAASVNPKLPSFLI